jgi:hypothetical protein
MQNRLGNSVLPQCSFLQWREVSHRGHICRILGSSESTACYSRCYFRLISSLRSVVVSYGLDFDTVESVGEVSEVGR